MGWPSYGRTRHAAVASPANEAMFLRRFLASRASATWTYRIMEAFDQPWKEQTEGAVGAYWGVWDVNRQPKFAVHSTHRAVSRSGRCWPAVSVLMAALLLTLLSGPAAPCRKRGRSFLAVIVYAATTTFVWVIYDYTQQYLTMTNVAVGLLLFIGMVGVILVLLGRSP